MTEAEALNDLGKTKDSLALLEKPAPAALSQFEARRLVDRANILDKEAPQDLEKARSLGPDEEQRIRICLSQAIVFMSQPTLSRSEALAKAAYELADKWKDPASDFYRARALVALGHFKKTEYRYSEALEIDERALDLAQKTRATRIRASALRNIGYLYAFFGEYKQGEEAELEAARIFGSMGDEPNRMTALGELGNVYNMEGNSVQAIENDEKAYYLGSRIGDEYALTWAGNAALAYIERGNWDQAEQWNRRANQRDPFVIWHYADIAAGRGQREKYFQLCREAIAKATTPALRWQIHFDMAEGYKAVSDPGNSFLEYERALSVFEEARSTATDNQKISFLPRLIHLFHAYVDDLIDDHQEAKALQVIEQSRARVLADRFGASETKGIRRPGKSSNTVFLSFWIAPKRSYVWLISEKLTKRFELPADDRIAAAVEDYQDKIQDLKDPLSKDFGNSGVLWDMLLKEAAGKIPPHSRVVVIPDGPLHQLNLETLVVPGVLHGEPPHYWLQDVEVVIAPSLALAPSFTANANGLEKRADPKVLLIGAPDYSKTKYPALKFAENEIEDIRGKFPSTQPTLIHSGGATPAAYFASHPEQYAIIHFAAHADADRENPLDSAVILSHDAAGNYKLYARDIYHSKIPLHADLVTVSACRSAGAKFYAGEGLIGFAWAFLASGARNVIGGLWDTDDELTSQLMADLYAGIAAGDDAVTALHKAKLKRVLDNSKPYYWAPLQIYSAAK